MGQNESADIKDLPLGSHELLKPHRVSLSAQCTKIDPIVKPGYKTITPTKPETTFETIHGVVPKGSVVHVNVFERAWRTWEFENFVPDRNDLMGWDKCFAVSSQNPTTEPKPLIANVNNPGNYCVDNWYLVPVN